MPWRMSMPGGFGTLDELFESLTLVQTGKTPDRPIILVGKAFWAGLLDWIREQLLGRNLILEEDLNLIRVIDDEARLLKKSSPITKPLGRLVRTPKCLVAGTVKN